jgi:hypothetical protein
MNQHDTHAEQLLFTIEATLNDLIAHMQKRQRDFSAYEDCIARIEQRSTDLWLAATAIKRRG